MSQPLADRIRPKSFDDIAGQSHLFGKSGAIRRMSSRGYITNMIFYGPPGTGKTTAADIIASGSGMVLRRLNATTASISDVREVTGESGSLIGTNGILLYLDEIQYFNKKQQQSLLEFLEDGRVTLIASTTENPYMYVYSAVISRSSVFEFYALTDSDILPVLWRGLAYLKNTSELPSADIFTAEENDTLSRIAMAGAGDVRRSLNLLETAFYSSGGILTVGELDALTPKIIGSFDKNGTVHYDMLSALQKSIRGSDPDAAVFYLAKILEGGDLIGACRRLQVIASEDIGAAYPMASVIVRSCVESANALGMPEAHIPLVNAVVLLATAPKSNSANIAYERAKADIDNGHGQNVPPYMRPSNQYSGYKYPHEYPNHWVEQQYLPDDIAQAKYYEYGNNKNENAAKVYWDRIKKGGES